MSKINFKNKYSEEIFNTILNINDEFLINLKEFKNKINVNKYPDFHKFKINVLEPCINEINEKTDYYFIWKKIKKSEIIFLNFIKKEKIKTQEFIDLMHRKFRINKDKAIEIYITYSNHLFTFIHLSIAFFMRLNQEQR